MSTLEITISTDDPEITEAVAAVRALNDPEAMLRMEAFLLQFMANKRHEQIGGMAQTRRRRDALKRAEFRAKGEL
jgi:hypothetical protein